MNIEEIRERHSKVEIDQYGSPAGEFYGELETSEFVDESHKDVAYLLSIIEQRDNLLVIVDDIVKAMSRPLEKTESGIAKLALMETLVQRYLYYKEHPNVLHEFLQVIRGK